MKEKVLNAKKEVIEEIKGNIKESQSMVLVDYRGLDVNELTQLRENFRKEGVVYKVYKNTMMSFAFKELGYDKFLDLLEGPNAVAFSKNDPISAARIANDFAKEHDKLEIKAGYMNDKFLEVNDVKELASIPPREVLIAKLLGSLKAPQSNFVYLIDAIAKSKEEDSNEAVEETTEA